MRTIPSRSGGVSGCDDEADGARVLRCESSLLCASCNEQMRWDTTWINKSQTRQKFIPPPSSLIHICI